MPRRPAQALMPLLLALLGISAGFALLMTRPNPGVDPADITATIEQLRAVADAADRHERATGEWPPSQSRGTTPLGGYITWRRTKNQAAVTIENATPDQLKAWHAIDQQLDDGDLTGGWVWWRDERLTWVLEEE